MHEGLFAVGLDLAEALKDDGVGALAVELDAAVGGADDGGHALAGRVELADVENLELLGHAEDVDKDGLGLAGLERMSDGTGDGGHDARTRNWNPRSSAPATRAASSGLLAW